MRQINLKLAVGAACILLASAPCGASGGVEVAAVSAGGTRIDFQPAASYERLVLTVATPEGAVVRREFAATESPFFELGAASRDGGYAWELRAAPALSAQQRERLAAARRGGQEGAAAARRTLGFDPDQLVQSGSFRVVGGQIVAGGPEPGGRRALTAPGRTPITAADQVIPDDLIVQGSECVGLDCVNNENFGFDTIRMKENNTRLQFDDTSTSAGFPTNNWQIRANASASGGTSFLAFVDQGATGTSETGTLVFSVEAGAAANALFVDSTSRVGLRTSTPVLDLHINTSNTPAIRLEQNNSGGFTAQTWDIGANEANFFVRDVTSGSRLPFRIRPGAPTSSLDISSDGDVGIGTASPSTRLHVLSSAAGATESKVLIESTNATSAPREMLELQNDHGAVQLIMDDGEQPPRWVLTASNAFLWDNTANVGTELQVDPDGTLRVNGTAMNVPDYVFDPGYKLMPLPELAAFVAANRHLPNVANSEDIKQNGLNLSLMPMQLLEKVEELTLYALEQHRQLEAMTRANSELAERLARLEAQLGAVSPQP